MDNDPRHWLNALRRSHDHLAELAGNVSDVSAPSFCSEWTIAQLLSHIGSGAEIGLGNLDAALRGEPAPGRDAYEAIWARWNAMAPEEQASHAVAMDERYVSTVEGLDEDVLASVRVTQFNGVVDAVGFLSPRLWEHALHTWDLEVMSDPTAKVQSGAVDLLAPKLPDRVGRAARGPRPNGPTSIALHLTDPELDWTLHIEEDAVSLDDIKPADQASLTGPAEAFVRLVAGRLDAEHTDDEVSVAGTSLDDLRALFAPR